MDTEELKYFLHDQAKEQFSTMHNYRDSSAKLEEINAYFLEYEEKQREYEYQAAMTLMEKGKYLQARDAFQTMNGYKDSNNMITECLYRRLCSILDVCQNNNMRGVKILLSDSSSAPTGIYIDDSALSSSREQIIDAVAVCFQEEGMKCREEETEDSSADTVDAYEPICTVIAEKFKQLNGYRDSEDKAVQAGDSGNFVDEFYDLLKNGSLREAGNWLTYSKEGIPEADNLEKWIELYTPWEGTWGLLEGDTSLIPYSCGLKEGQVLVEFRAKVCIDNEKAVLHIEDPEGDYAVDLECDAGNTYFCRIEDGYYYYAKLTDPTVFLYMRYLENGTITSSCVYCK